MPIRFAGLSLTFDISQKIKLANPYLLSGLANCELMTHLSSARLAVTYDLSLALDNKDGGLCAELTLSARRESAVPVSAPTAPSYTTLLEPEYVILAKAMKILI